jgi:tRNA threonylcarbamoyladenosine biosynthesis protein TsaE
VTTGPQTLPAQPGGNKSAWEIVTHSLAETIAVGRALAGYLNDGDVVLLHGDLGAGKTMLAKGIAAGLGVSDVVSSPSFTLVNEYDTGPAAAVSRLYHLDLYRLHDEGDLASIGFDDLVASTAGVVLVEWPERAATVLPERFLLIEIEAVGSNYRRLRFVPSPDDDVWMHRFDHLRSDLAINLNWPAGAIKDNDSRTHDIAAGSCRDTRDKE